MDSRRVFTVSKLNLRLWVRLFGMFLMIDVLLCGAAAVALVGYAEHVMAGVVGSIPYRESLGDETKTVLAASGLTVESLEGDPTGIPIPGFLWRVFPENTSRGWRAVKLETHRDGTWWQQLDSLSYQLEVQEPGPYRLVLTLTPVVGVMKTLALVLLVLQGLYLIQSMVTGASIIRRTLRPIVELAEKAQSVRTDKGPFTPKEMEALAGKLQGINAAHLDTRIEVGDGQDDLKGVATAINGMLARIHDSYQAQARFVSDASHELRTPIAAVQGYANLLDRWGKNDPQALQESIDAIKDEAANMKDLVEKLLFLARGDNHTLELDREHIDLGHVAEAVCRETQMIDGGHEIVCQASSVLVFGDGALVKQTLRILVDNALKYTPAGGVITVRVEQRDNQAWLVVQDEGIGIPADAVGRVLDRFYRADASRARATGGTGLGLSIAKWIVERHGGRIEILSREGLGTRVSVVLPQDASV